jgi:hypothetical protein
MNTLTKQIIGAVIGGSAGYFIGDVIVEYIRAKNHRKFLTDEDLYTVDDFEDEEITEETIMDKTSKKIKEPKNYGEFYQLGDRIRRPDLEALVNKYNGEGVNEPFLENELKEDIDPSIGKYIFDNLKKGLEYDGIEEETELEESKDPSIISKDEYDGNEAFTKVKLLYYDDDVLTNAQNKVVPRPEKILGEDALVSFGESSGDPEKVYVRNELKGCMYEVVRTNKLYNDLPSLKREIRSRPKIEAKEEKNEEADNT